MLSNNEAQMSNKKCLECCAHSFIFHSYSQLASSSLALCGNLVVVLLKTLWDGVLTDKQFNLMFYKLLQFLILVMAIFYNCYLEYFEQRPSTARHFCEQYSAWSLFCVSSLLIQSISEVREATSATQRKANEWHKSSPWWRLPLSCVFLSVLWLPIEALYKYNTESIRCRSYI